MVHLIPQIKHTLKFISEIHGSTQTPSTQPCNPHSPTKHTLRHHQSIEINEVYRHWHIKNDYMPVCRLHHHIDTYCEYVIHAKSMPYYMVAIV
jgi:hypothetical protein